MGDLRKEWQAPHMRIEEWWPKLDPATQEWLIANNGDVVPTIVLGQIAEAGGDLTSDAERLFSSGRSPVERSRLGTEIREATPASGVGSVTALGTSSEMVWWGLRSTRHRPSSVASTCISP